MSELPAPMTPADCDLRGMEWMPLYGHRLFSSDFEARASDAAFRAAMRLWWVAWQQVPAASLPDDDAVLCRHAGLGRDLKGWKKIKAEAMHGFILCADGRLYHKMLAKEAREAWDRRVKERERKANWRGRKGDNGGGTTPGPNAPNSKDGTRTETGTREGHNVGRDGDMTRTSPLTGQDRTGQDKEREEVAKPDSGPPPHAPAREAVPLMPSLADPHHRWAHLGEKDEIDGETGKRHPVVAGWYLDDVCRFVCEAAGINDASFRGDWRPIIAWLKDGLDPHDRIIPAIRQVAARPSYRPSDVRSFAYFDAAVRQQARVA